MAEVLGEKLWAFQREVVKGVFEHGKASARTCHGVGKTRVAADIVLTFLMTREDSIVITTAPTDHQVRNLLWGEIGRLHGKAKVELPGSPDQKQLRLGPKWYALGLSTNKPARFQGFHGSVDVPHDPDEDVDLEAYAESLKALEDASVKAGNGGILIVFDEAAGIDQAIFDAAKGALTSPDSHILYIGNPDLDIAEQHEFVRSHGLNSEFHRIRCGAEEGPTDPLEPAADSESAEHFVSFDKVPNWIMDPNWLEERKADYGHGSPLYYSKVWGMFAGVDSSARLMPHELLHAALSNECAAQLGAHIGVDVAGQGGDESVAALVVNGEVRAMHAWRPRVGDKSPLMSVVNMVTALRNKWGEALEQETGKHSEQAIPWENVHVEINGVGAGVCDRFRQLGRNIDRVDASKPATYGWRKVTGNVRFLNVRAELHWAVRRLAEEGMFKIDAGYADAWGQMQWTTYEHKELAAGTTIKMCPKKDIRKAYGRSPDHADAVFLAFSRKKKLRLSSF